MQQDNSIARDVTMEKLFERHSEMLFVYLRQHTHTREDAEDMLVETFMAALAEMKFALQGISLSARSLAQGIIMY